MQETGVRGKIQAGGEKLGVVHTWLVVKVMRLNGLTKRLQTGRPRHDLRGPARAQVEETELSRSNQGGRGDPGELVFPGRGSDPLGPKLPVGQVDESSDDWVTDMKIFGGLAHNSFLEGCLDWSKRAAEERNCGQQAQTTVLRSLSGKQERGKGW